MSNRCKVLVLVLVIVAASAFSFVGCGSEPAITRLDQLEGKEFAVPRGTVADKLVLSRFPDAQFIYFDSALDCSLAVKEGKADVAAYDEPILRNIAAKNDGLVVLPEMITVDNYGFAVALGNEVLKTVIDHVVAELKDSGTYDQMVTRWLPEKGNPAAMPALELQGTNGVLRLGTAAITEPFSFFDESRQVVGFDIELATYVAKELGTDLEVINMGFGELIPAVKAGEVDMIGACITITEERAKTVLFSEPYYQGGIAALVRG